MAAEECPPIEEDERVLRLIHKSYFDAKLEYPVQRAAFRPTDQDKDGLSVFREKFFAVPCEILRNVAQDKRGNYPCVARFSISKITALSLTVVADSDDGHAIIPEINKAEYESDKKKWRPVLIQLALLAGKKIVKCD